MTSGYSEDDLIEQPAIELFETLHWKTKNCFDETFRPGGESEGRETSAEVILIPRLRAALKNLNPETPEEVITAALEEFTRSSVKRELLYVWFRSDHCRGQGGGPCTADRRGDTISCTQVPCQDQDDASRYNIHEIHTICSG